MVLWPRRSCTTRGWMPCSSASVVRFVRPDDVLGSAATIRVEERRFLFRFRSVEQHVDHFTTNYPPVAAAVAALDGDAADDLARDLRRVAASRNVSDGPDLVLPMDYLEVVATKHAD
jgi:hypothetical protein